ncbi:MAG: hypothetical protein ACI4JR_01955 [Acutalibacteraceae bacterium]
MNDLLSAVQTLFQNITIDAVIHAMAVSDYRIKAVTSSEDVSKRQRTHLLSMNSLSQYQNKT